MIGQLPGNLGATDLDEVAETFGRIALEAGSAVMRIYASSQHARQKSDGSPVSDADETSEALILERLASLFPHLPVLAEEAASQGKRAVIAPAFILVDPLDGTREFLSRNGEFTINIALVMGDVPRAGAVFAPALGKLWLGGKRAWVCEAAPGGPMPPAAARRDIAARRAPKEGLTAVVSRSHADPETESFLARLPVTSRKEAGSALKFCLVAEGEADVYPRFGPTMEWDTAAGDAILRAAGGIVADAQGQPLHYGKFEMQFKNGPFVAWGDPKSAAVERPNLVPPGERQASK